MLFSNFRPYAMALSLVFIGTFGSALAQGPPLGIADNPVDLNGSYLCPGAGSGWNGYARATTDPGHFHNQVFERSSGIFVKEGTFTPFNDLTKWPARLAVDLTGKTIQFDVDLKPGNPAIDMENAIFAAGVGTELGSSTEALAQVEITKSGNAYQFSWRSGAGGVTPITTWTPASPLPTQYRIRISFTGGIPTAPAMATVVITPLNNTLTPSDFVSTNLVVSAPVDNAGFVAGFLAMDGVSTSRGQAVISGFTTNAGPNHMWMMADNPYKSNDPLATPGALAATLYHLGMSNPTEEVHAWQAIINPVLTFSSMSFLPGLPVFDTVMVPPFNGTLENNTYFGQYPNGVLRGGAYSFLSVPAGTLQSSFLADMTFTNPGFEYFQRPSFIATDPAGGPGAAITTLQGVGSGPMASVLRESSGVVVDNSHPFASQLRVIQDSVSNPGVLHQGPVTIRFRAEDTGLWLVGDLGSGLSRYPRAVLRPAANTSIAPGVQTGDVDLSDKIYPYNDNLFEANLTIGTPGTLDVPCGNYHVVTWVEDRVGLISTPSTSITPFAGGYNGATPVFEIRKFNSLTLNVSIPGFAGSAPDPIHASPPRFQRWVTVTIGGPSTGTGPAPVQTYQKLMLLDPAGNGVLTLTAADGLPCPGPNMWVSIKDQQHSLRRLVPINLTPNTSDYIGNTSLVLGDLNNDNRVGIGDFGVFLGSYGMIYSQNDITYAGPTVVTHCDLSGNRRVWFEDYLFIQNNNNLAGDALPGSYQPRTPIFGEDATKIMVTKLLSMGVSEAKRYDFNGDGWVTWDEMQKVLALKTARKW